MDYKEGNAFGNYVLKFGLEKRAIQADIENPFDWNSHQMPLDINMQMITSHYGNREMIVEGFKVLAKGIYYDVIAEFGDGITCAGSFADIFQQRVVRVKNGSSEKKYRNKVSGLGREESLEGSHVILVGGEISTGESVARTAELVREEGGTCKGVLCVFDYNFSDVRKRFSDLGLDIKSLGNYGVLANLARREGYWTESQIQELNRWHQEPFNWWENRQRQIPARAS